MKTSNFYLSILIILFFLGINSCYSQSENPILAMDVEASPLSNFIYVDSVPQYSDSTVFGLVMHVKLYDTTDIQEVEVIVGTTQGASDLFSYSFAFDVTSGLPTGVIYQRDEFFLELDLGQFSNAINYYATVRVKDSNNSYSPIIAFNR